MKILLINLPESVDRLKLFSESAKRYSADYSITTGINISSSDRAMCQEYSERANKFDYYKKLTKGEIGCFLSHRKAWSIIVEQRLPFAIVLEDDVMFEASFRHLGEVIDKFNESWDYIKLNEVHEKRATKTMFTAKGGEVVKYKKLPIGASAQLVSYNGAVKLLKYTESFSRPVDVELQWLSVDKIKAFGIKPYPFKTRKVQSEIDRLGKRGAVRGNTLIKFLNLLKFKFHLLINEITRS